MKNATALKTHNKLESPKTPGGISKSLLTPCRRVGLSRNWRKNGPSPFVSPLASSAEAKEDKSVDTPIKRETRKRKDRPDEEDSKEKLVETPEPKDIIEDREEITVVDKSDNLESTPSRTISNLRRKKSKTLLSSRIDENNVEPESPKTKDVVEKLPDCIKRDDTNEVCDDTITIDKPVRTKSKGKESNIKLTIKVGGKKVNESKENTNISKLDSNKETVDQPNEIKAESCKKSPENLTKECIVVIQKKIYKKDLEKLKQKARKDEVKINKNMNPVSQALFDSDYDDVPLSVINNKEVKCKPIIETIDEDDDFAENTKVKVKKLEDKTTSVSDLKSNSSKTKTRQKETYQKSKTKCVEPKESNPILQSSLDDDEDFVMDNKRTILIRKSYDKVSEPLKAKSTGSITQKDIDELKARIEMKKKLLLAKAVTEDTEELRDLIKKWQKGCQDALMELMELMKTKFPDKQNMDYSEILQTLKIPPSLVGYDEDNDCFCTPTDENILLSKFYDT